MLALLTALGAAPLAAQTFPTADPVLQRIWEEGTKNSQLKPLAQALLDSVGPRLTGSPGQAAADQWALAQYRAWGIPARAERYGTWAGWRRGVTHVDLLQPRVRSLEATMLPWSPGTQGPVSAPVVALPAAAGPQEFAAWLPQVQGKFVAISLPQPTCRPEENWKQYASPASYQRMQDERRAAQQAWEARVAATGVSPRDLPQRLEQAGAAGVLVNNWAGGWGVEKLHPSARTQRVPTIDVSCEDYGLLVRLAEQGQGPVLRVHAEAEALGEVPVHNVVAELRGRERPNEYVVLSAHFDSWDGASGATDNGTGTVTMMEAMRILRRVYPNPKRTILVGHWGGEEQGLNGSRAFAADHPEVVRGLQAVFNQDNGTGRIRHIGMQGLTHAGSFFARWFAQLPRELTDSVSFDIPGAPSSGSSDHASFVCAGAPSFFLLSLDWGYGVYTWHTNRDTYDKVVFDDVQRNALLIASLAYLASEDPQTMPRERRTVLPTDARTGQAAWPTCQPPARSAAASGR
mgnify:FL=1